MQIRITRVIEQVSRGTIADEDVLAILPGLKAERMRLKAELEAEEAPTNIIELKPKAVEKFREDVEQLADIVNSPGAEPSIELGRAFREVVSSVIVHPRQPGCCPPLITGISGLIENMRERATKAGKTTAFAV
ncbi:hypothetical protein [Rhizobium lusitanum]|uniref:Site-specific DNA recombinase n=1 Tax=Rhizobium lusitanum TaxID=293958 RepID=A0A1C3URX9_9HYPH|nr:hypothetical protein [Rhizobium lusitanum]SCB18194.1 site-specific DNA recombinase [Rhizobium lusitanum]